MLRNKEIILDERPALTVLNSINDVVQSSLFGVIFSATRQTLETNARFFVLPMALMGDTIRAIFALSDWFDAKNKNFRKTFRLFLEMAKLIVVATAIIGSLAGCIAIAAVTPFLFIGAIGSSMLYHAALSISHGYKWAVAKGPAETAHHKQHFYSNLLGMVTGIAVTAAIAVLLAFKPELGIFNFIIGTVATIMTGITAIYAGISGYSYFKNRKYKMSVSPEVIENDLDYAVHSRNGNTNSLVNNALPKVANSSSHIIDHNNDLSAANENGHRVSLPEKRKLDVTGKIDLFHEDLISDLRNQDEADQQLYVNNIIQEKIEKLAFENGSLNVFYPDKQKVKITALKMLRQLVNDGRIFVEDKEINSVNGLLNYLDEKKIRGTVMNSFLKNVGDVQKIFLLANAYLADNKPVMSKVNDYSPA